MHDLWFLQYCQLFCYSHIYLCQFPWWDESDFIPLNFLLRSRRHILKFSVFCVQTSGWNFVIFCYWRPRPRSITFRIYAFLWTRTSYRGCFGCCLHNFNEIEHHKLFRKRPRLIPLWGTPEKVFASFQCNGFISLPIVFVLALFAYSRTFQIFNIISSELFLAKLKH